MLVLFAGLAGAMALAGHAAEGSRYVTVQPGETLSELAEREMPKVDRSDAVYRLQQVNSLPLPEVHSGLTLLIPRDG